MPTDTLDKVALYHFTTLGNFKAIQREGLTRGRVELSHDPQEYVDAICLTDSSVPKGHGIDLGPATLTDSDRLGIRERTGWLPPKGARFGDPTAVRITLQLERSDLALIRWYDFRSRVLPSRRKELERGCRVSTWWVYLGVIPPENFSAIHYRHGTEYHENPPA